MVIVTKVGIKPLHSAAIFLAILYSFTFAWMLGNPPRLNSLGSFLAWFLPVVWAPTVVAVVLMAIERGGADALRELRRRLTLPSGAARWLAIAVVVPMAIQFAAIAAARAAGDAAPFVASSGLPQMVGIQIVTGAIGEEIGWRGFLLPRLGQRLGAKGAAWAMGVLWSLWHVPAFFTPGLPHQFMPMWLVLPAVACFGVFMAFVFNRAGGSVLVTMAAHLSLNVFSGIGGIEFSSPVFWGVVAAGMFGAAILATSYAWRDSRDRSVDGGRSPTFSSP
jgi:membrane protease YdiL (CAAX protease family)